MSLPAGAEEVLRRGALCYLAAPTAAGPHVTPVVFVLDGGRLWATTSRHAAKTGAWRVYPVASGLVRHGERALAFRGPVTLYDAFDPTTWPAALGRAFRGARAAARFTLKNSRFFAGYARDARRVPLAWTPPGRVAVSVDLEAGAVLDLAQGAVAERWGRWGSRRRGKGSFRSARGKGLPERDLPTEARSLLRGSGDGVVGLAGTRGPVVLPARWVRSGDEGVFYAVLPAEFLALAAALDDAPASLVIDRASRWRAANMVGVTLLGRGRLFVTASMGSGRDALLARAHRAGPLPPDPAVIRLRPERAVWWSGWASGTVTRG